MTRRAPASLKVINENPDDWFMARSVFTLMGFKTPEKSGFTEFGFSKKGSGLMSFISEPQVTVKPTYKVGEVVYIKEPYHEDELGLVRYKYDFSEDNEWRNKTKFKNKLFVGADMARYYIRITHVTLERLYDISDEDCLKEGIDMVTDGNTYNSLYYDYQHNQMSIASPQESFFSLFRFANKVPKSKEIPNIWCFAYSYVLCDINGNE